MPFIMKPQQSQIAASERSTDPHCHFWWKQQRLSAQGTETELCLSTPTQGMRGVQFLSLPVCLSLFSAEFL